MKYDFWRWINAEKFVYWYYDHYGCGNLDIFRNKDYLEKANDEYLLAFGTGRNRKYSRIPFVGKAKWIRGQQFIADGGKSAH